MNRNDIFTPQDADADLRYRLRTYTRYLDNLRLLWVAPDLNHYRNYLEKKREFAPNTIMAHLQTVVRRYRELLELDDIDMYLEREADSDAQVQHFRALISAAAQYKVGDLDLPDTLPSYNLSPEPLQMLFQEVRLYSPLDLRDLILIGLPFCAGLTEKEVLALKCKHIDFEQQEISVPAVQSPEPRRVYLHDGKLFTRPWLLAALSVWIEVIRQAHLTKHNSDDISERHLFSGFYGTTWKLRETPLSEAGYKKALSERTQPTKRNLTARDLRHTFARWAYRRGVSFEEVRDNLGLVKMSSTLTYIGPPELDEDYKALKPIYSGWIRRQLKILKKQVGRDLLWYWREQFPRDLEEDLIADPLDDDEIDLTDSPLSGSPPKHIIIPKDLD